MVAAGGIKLDLAVVIQVIDPRSDQLLRFETGQRHQGRVDLGDVLIPVEQYESLRGGIHDPAVVFFDEPLGGHILQKTQDGGPVLPGEGF